MVLYARADVSYVCVPAASGGCGSAHTRPVVNGAPAKQFILNCQGCENFLRADIARSGGNKKVRTVNGDFGLALKDRYLGLWGASADTIPETPDAELKREHDEQAMVTKNAASQTETLAQIGAAVAGNAELMGKFIELTTMLTAQQHSTVPAAPPEVLKTETWQQRLCVNCSTPIVRKPGQNGALAQRCPDCKAKQRQKAA